VTVTLAWKDLRTRFQDLSVGPNGPTVETSDSGARVLSDEQLEREPLKWLKYLLMDAAGLEPITKIASQIQRFGLDRFDQAIEWIEHRLTTLECEGADHLIVAKVVPWDRGAQLRNFRLHSVHDLHAALGDIRSLFTDDQYCQLWCCESSVASSGFNLGGRITWPDGRGPQILELVWYKSPRFVELVSLPSFATPYLRAERAHSVASFEIGILHIPAPYDEQGNEALLSHFHAIALELERRRAGLRELVSYVRALGAGEVCFCFKVSDGELTVIDWDSEIESMAR
jgi:hypothetical protein